MLSDAGDSERDELEAERAQTEQMMGKDRAALGRLVQAVSAGALDIDACAVENERITNRLKAAQKRLDEIDAELARTPGTSERLALWTQVAALPIDLASVDSDKGRLLLQRAAVRVWCEAGQIKRVEVG